MYKKMCKTYVLSNNLNKKKKKKKMFAILFIYLDSSYVMYDEWINVSVLSILTM
jgi:hypothetical protein